MDEKIFLDSNGLTRDSFALARKIYDDGFRPDVIIGLWRGGTPVAVAVQEFLQYLGVGCYHTAVKTQAYTGIGEHKHPVIENLGTLLDHLKDAERVLVVDDIFDSGDTAAAVKETLKPFVKDAILLHMKDGVCRQEAKNAGMKDGLLDMKVDLLPLGSGDLPIRALVDMATESKAVIVELDYCKSMEMFAALKKSYDFMVSNGIAE